MSRLGFSLQDRAAGAVARRSAEPPRRRRRRRQPCPASSPKPARRRRPAPPREPREQAWEALRRDGDLGARDAENELAPVTAAVRRYCR